MAAPPGASPAGKGSPAVLRRIGAAPEGALLGAAEASRLFTSESVGALKLVLLTGVEPGPKIEALRKLAFAPVTDAERGVLAVRALTDAAASVRREAAGLLKGFGLDPEAASALETLADDAPRRRQFAADMLGRIGPGLNDGERIVLVAGLLGALPYEQDDAALAAVLRALAELGPALTAREEFLLSLTANLLPRLAERFDALSPPVRRLLCSLTRAKGLAEILRGQAERVPDRKVRGFLLEVAMDLPVENEGRVALARDAAREVAGWPEPDFRCRALGDRLSGLGAPAVEAILDVLPEAPTVQRPYLVQLLDRAAGTGGGSASLRERAGRALADLWGPSDRPVRAAVLETALGAGAGLSPGVKRDLAAAYLSSSSAAPALDRFPALLDEAVVGLGMDVLGLLAERAREGRRPEEIAAAVRAIGEIVRRTAALPKKGPSFSDLFGRVKEVESRGEAATRDAAVLALGRACAGRVADPKQIEETARRYRAALNPGDAVAGRQAVLLDALGWIAAGARTPSAMRVDLLLFLVGAMTTEPGGELAVETRTRDGLTVEMGRAAAFHTDQLPIILRGIGRALAAGGLPAKVQEESLRGLLIRWREATSFRVVWAPGNVTALGEALGEIGSSDAVPEPARLAVFRAMGDATPSQPILRWIARVGRWGPRSTGFARAGGAVLGRLLDLADRGDFQDLEDRQTLVLTAGRLALNRVLGGSAGEAERLRMRTVERLSNELTSDFFRGLALAEEMAETAHVPRKARELLSARLENVRR